MLGRALRHFVVGSVTNQAPPFEAPREAPRSPLTALRGERLAGIGHNQGPPLDAAFSWRRHVWKKARKALVPRLPLEVVKRRVRRATELGLEYPQYASILLGTGRDIVGFLFTCDALGMELARGRVPEAVRAKLDALIRVERLLGAQAPRDPARLAAALAQNQGLVFAETVRLPTDSAPWGAGRDAIAGALAPLRLPSDAVVMIGTEPHHRTWADAAQMAKFLPADQFFPGTA